MTTMRAARFESESGKLTVADVPIPTPGPGEALVRVAACGICHSDLGLLDGTLPTSLPVVTPGHEAAGEVVELGSPSPFWNEGDQVVIAAGRACGACRPCGEGDATNCQQMQVMGFHYDGGWAEYTVVPIAVLADAVSTPYAAVRDTGAVRAGESVGVWGVGGVGTHLVQIARLVGATPIIAVDPLPAARDRALELGADHALDPTADDFAAQLASVAPIGLDVVFDVVAQSSTITQTANALGPKGRLIVVGMTSADNLDLGPVVRFALFSQTAHGHFGYRKQHLDQLVTLVDSGRLDVSRSVSAVLDLEDVHEGIRRLEERDGNPIRILLKPARRQP
ncbi:zinc-binding dehydrogenase [Pseudonocardia spinosispora]|uniref:zinc-binding dehydrogenase n=1 Tax=Pseudonocardia spinosispora TaxID=103441 RepID=UPI00040E385A|nr:zinc-binding dehydrogenase [Pseudonocardia spinosispora]